MASKDLIRELFKKYKIPYRKADSYKNLAEQYCNGSIEMPLEEFTYYCRSNWDAAPINIHIDNLKSGLLQGHSWHKAMPSMLHLSMQNQVRECIEGKLTLSELISIGSDIMKHEYFMVATHDLCESSLINNIETIIPPTRDKSISDFIFNGIPYDLKVSTYPDDFSLTDCTNRSEYIKSLSHALYVGADKERMRKQADKAGSNWAFNRFYIMVKNQDRWLSSPEDMIKDVVAKSKTLGEPEVIWVHDIEILVQLIEV